MRDAMRDTIFVMVEKAGPGDHYSKLYDWFITAVAFVSLVPLMFKGSHPYLDMLDLATVYVLFMDYIFRWITFDLRVGRRGSVRAFVEYPITPLALIDLLSILPSLGLLGRSFQILRVLRIFKVLHYSKNFMYVSNVFKKERKTLTSVLVIALAYIFVSALALFSYEPDTFDNFFEALYWATTALTTVGYGDIYPVTQIGKFISMISSLFGIAVIALPAGIITGGFVEQIQRGREEEVMEETGEAAQEAAEAAQDAAEAAHEAVEAAEQVVEAAEKLMEEKGGEGHE